MTTAAYSPPPVASRTRQISRPVHSCNGHRLPASRSRTNVSVNGHPHRIGWSYRVLPGERLVRSPSVLCSALEDAGHNACLFVVEIVPGDRYPVALVRPLAVRHDAGAVGDPGGCVFRTSRSRRRAGTTSRIGRTTPGEWGCLDRRSQAESGCRRRCVDPWLVPFLGGIRAKVSIPIEGCPTLASR